MDTASELHRIHCMSNQLLIPSSKSLHFNPCDKRTRQYIYVNISIELVGKTLTKIFHNLQPLYVTRLYSALAR